MKPFNLHILGIVIFLLPQIVHAQQTNSQNYVISKTYKQAGANENDVSQVTTHVQYLDGLGRLLQNVGVKQSPSGEDLVQPAAFDNVGRKPNDYLPYVAAGNGSYQANVLTAVGSWYSTNTALLQKTAASDLERPFTETYFEQSLDRPTGQRAPGTRSANSSVQYFANAANEVKRYDYNSASNTVVQNGNYAAAMLTRIQSTDEQGIITNQYVDKSGQLICRNDAGTGHTYYVFDNQGLLRAVLQPKFQDDPNFTSFAFLYDYDARNRMVRKQMPGAGSVEIVYDQFDRPAMSRDANQLTRNVWGFTKYDALNRAIATGEIVSGDSRTTWAANVDAGVQHHEIRNNGVAAGYTLNNTAPKTATEANLLTITFYDDYGFSKAAGLSYLPGYYPANNVNVKGQETGSRTRMLLSDGTNGSFLTSVTYYDAEYRPVQTIRELYDLGATAYERTSIKYKFDLAPVVEEQKTEQVLSGATTNTHLSSFTYDHADRLLSVKEKVITGTKTKEVYTVAQRYNSLGQLQSKWLHSYDGTKYRRRTDYTYNIRGWQTDVKTVYKQSDAVPQESFYAIHASHRTNANYSNGSIDSLLWRYTGEAAFTAGLKFTYDAASRMSGSTGIFGYTNTESGITYDKNGNLATLTRAGAAVDQLTYSYVGNRLSAVGDGSGSNLGVKSGASSYAYDGNGNMSNDGNRGATITYNYLNLPKTVTIGANPAFKYEYDATGNKHKYVNAADAFTAKYAGVFQYDGANALKRGATSEGQVIVTPDSLRFDYYIKDHLGNVRIVFNEKGEIIQNTEYYPFGLAIPKDGKTPTERNAINRFLYNEKELQVGSGYLDYGARMYMPEVGRWGTSDPLAELSRRFSPYTYGYNNPLRFIDPDGRLADDPQKGIFQRIFDFLGLFKKPETQEEAALYSNRQETFNQTVDALEKGSDELKNKAEWVPFIGAITDISQGAVRKDNTQVILGMASFGLDALPGPGGGKVGMGLANEFFESATKAWGEQGLTVIGRALQKHAGREGSVFQGIEFSHKTANQEGLSILNQIINSPNVVIQKANGGGQYVFDKTTGRGFGVSRDGLFNGFRELFK
ncbi:RHS repeat domain-containing protein [Dyadobacter sp. CY323]|uniref:RHS repeat domain-containing protein n=1 Tax=Dyadobacter sp. CY323 TaxID=2907302 RepID=UPI001F3E1175|nr:DUF6443 domain-containing protein [Dyadobacter sp. CY323]MCE6988871.1 RHS repeat-associated core domain-containing protein [Dyadobacter sp. CY323]